MEHQLNEKYTNNYYNKYLIYKLILVIIALMISTLYIFISDFKNFVIKISKKIQIKPKIIAISYGNRKFQRQIQINKLSALKIGKVNEYYCYGPNDIDPEFRYKNKDILYRKRGNGYWLWKPYFILKTLKEKLNEGDYLIYTDAGIMYMNSTRIIIDFLSKRKAEIWAIQTHYIEKKWTKRDAFILLGADMPFYTETAQYMAGIQIYKKSKFTENFLEEVLYYSQDKRIITDEPNTLGFNNYRGFRANRHDQTVLSIMIKKYGQASSGKTNMNINQLRKTKIEMPYIFCIYRRKFFKNYKDIRKKCINHYYIQNQLYFNKKN